ncbi:hypothetical protein [Nocardia sp. alder85J]|uniref:hypothetical protein n=1 Tax=Nocardia sp. alder85J TaxID=2862949 RepID=UPI001CD53609|nr:hypothetical protein [Nocardia sp. alder85J]MCX4099004.1 hypothetical protein [Nocardia sp. alder85J]
MKRIVVLAVAAGALTLAGCGGNDSAPAPAGLRQASATGSAVAAPSSASAVSSASAPAPETATAPGTSTAAPVATGTLGPASATPCGRFKTMDVDAEKALMEQVLAENPGSKFEGSPNVALGTAKLVCLSSSRVDTPVAVAIGIATG